jgi:hypothetical protein
MTKENFTSINVIIDQSGSMSGLTNDTIGGFNQFLSDQNQEPGEAVFTLCLFNTSYQLPYNFVKLADVPSLTDKVYRPSGGTALLDAVGTTIDQVGSKLDAMPEEERPSKVIFLIITDGDENSSREYSKAKIKSMVSHQRDTYNWEFVFMGANIDAISEGSSLGIAAHNSVNYSASAAGTHDLYKGISSNMRSYRSSKGPGSVDFFNQNNTQPAVTPAVVITPADSTPPVSKDKP